MIASTSARVSKASRVPMLTIESAGGEPVEGRAKLREDRLCAEQTPLAVARYVGPAGPPTRRSASKAASSSAAAK